MRFHMGKQSKGRGIKVVPYNEQWPSEFEKIRHEIATALGCQTANYNRVQQQIKIPSDTYQTARSCL